MIHGGVTNISEFVFYSSDADKKKQDLKTANADCIIGGHCGIPFGQRVGDAHWLNAGVIGMPANDGTTRGWYMLIEPTEMSIDVSWHALEFNFHDAASAMKAANLPQAYQQTLEDGCWPSLSILPEAESRQQSIPLTLPPMQINTGPNTYLQPPDAHFDRPHGRY